MRERRVDDFDREATVCGPAGESGAQTVHRARYADTAEEPLKGWLRQALAVGTREDEDALARLAFEQCKPRR